MVKTREDIELIVERIVAAVTVIGPFLVVIGSIFAFWNRGVDWLDLILCFSLVLLTGIGITVGYHRLFTHRSFKCVLPLKLTLGILGCMASQGAIYWWAAFHRHHHQCSDEKGDPHSPYAFGSGIWARLRGIWHAHVGWILGFVPQNHRLLVPDLLNDPVVAWIDRWYFLWVLLGLLLPALITWAITPTWSGFLHGLIWGGIIRMFLAHHITWSVNSLCHLFGTSPFPTGDHSRNNLICVVFSLGEGWHNNHHAFPSSSRHGLFWYQFDSSYALLIVFRFFGLAWDLIEPSDEQIQSALQRKSGKLVLQQHNTEAAFKV